MDAQARLASPRAPRGERARGVVVGAPRPAVLVVDRHPAVPADRMVAARRDQREGRHHPLRDAPVVVVVLGVAARADVKAAGRFRPPRNAAPGPAGCTGWLLRAPLNMGSTFMVQRCRNDTWLESMPPSIACSQLHSCRRLETKRLGCRHHRPFVLRQRRLALGGPHVGPQHAAALDERIALQLDALAEARVLRLRRDLDALAGDVVLPAVVRAAQPALLVAAEPERDAAMRAELVDQAEAALRVAEGDQLLATAASRAPAGSRARAAPRRAAPAASSGGTARPSACPVPVRVRKSFCSALTNRVPV